jgi:hypothetical protein
MPLAESNGASAFDLIRDLAAASGQTFYVDNLKRLQFRVTSNQAAPALTVSTVETASIEIDRETYRNVQRVMVTGTPTGNEEAATSSQERSNVGQITERAILEGGSGRYEDVEEVTHPTSNASADLALLGISYANLRLATSGALRQTLKCRVRQYGVRAGQFATVTLNSLGISGTWLIQRVAVQEEDGRRLINDLELVRVSLQQRAYESWLRIVKAGKITVQMPGAITSNLQIFSSPGAATWTVPANVTVAEFTCHGPGGGGGRGFYLFACAKAIGNNGGNGGKAVSIVTVTAGQIFDIFVGNGGAGGVNDTSCGANNGTAGAPGSAHSSVALSASIKCQGDLGTGGSFIYGIPGADGSGIGDGVTVGGGALKGLGGLPESYQPTNGSAGSVEVRW